MSGLGHFGLGFAAKRFAPKVPLAVLLLASEAVDVIWIIAMLVDPDRAHAGYLSHGLFMSGLWTIAAALITFVFSRNARSALTVGLVVFSHWLLDFVVWPMTAFFPDSTGVPLFFQGSPRIGLGLYRWAAVAVPNDAALVIAGVVVYHRSRAVS